MTCSTVETTQYSKHNTLGLGLGLGRLEDSSLWPGVLQWCAARVLSEEQCSNSTSQEANLRNRRPQPICLQEQNREYTQLTSHYQQYLPQASTLVVSRQFGIVLPSHIGGHILETILSLDGLHGMWCVV